MSKTKSLREEANAATEVAEASGEIIDGSPVTALAQTAPGANLIQDLDESDFDFPRLTILQGISRLAQEEDFSAGDIVLDQQYKLDKPIEFTVLRMGKLFEENVDWDSGEIPRVLSKAAAVEAGGSFEWGHDGSKPDWMPVADAFIAIRGEDPEIFPFEFGDGMNVAFALWRIKGVAYKRAAVKMFTAFRTYYRDGFSSGTFSLTTSTDKFNGKTVVVPQLKKGTANDEEFREWLATLITA
ncbi:MAG: hypothetical protein CL532_01645 [Aestuariivita sp.]|nr:hypothetical protein [Aestuariivita sp.]|tara:strand:- start:215 stop:937 length:723 start_codon:yes stop_codon:yes gene_type:complete